MTSLMRVSGGRDPGVVVTRSATVLCGQAAVNAVVAAGAASMILWLAPPGVDFSAHVYQLGLYVHHGFLLWTNYWYSGRYTFVDYSLIYYPLAALVGMKPLAVLSAAAAAAAFTVLLRRVWGDSALWPTRLFAVVVAGMFISASFPYGLGVGFGLVALLALLYERLVVFAIAVVLTLAASPLAFLFLVLVIGCVGLSWREVRRVRPVAIVLLACAALVLSWRLFPESGIYPFPSGELLAALAFCGAGALLTWRIPAARTLGLFFVAYAALCLLSFLIPSGAGENVDRLRYAAIPIMGLVLALRRWKPRPVAVAAFVLAGAWNLSPLVYNFAHSNSDPSAAPGFWRPAIGFLQRNLTPDYRVEIVDTVDHWEAAYLPQAGIPLARGWFRQEDFPQNELLYDQFSPRAYRRWLRSLGVRYVVLTTAPQDWSAHHEAALLRSGRSGLKVVFRSRNEKIFSLPHPTPIVTGPDHPTVTRFTQSSIVLRVQHPGRYRVAVHYSPYFAARGACVRRTNRGMTLLDVPRVGTFRLAFTLTPSRALSALTGISSSCAQR